MIIKEYISGISTIGILSLATEKFGLVPYFAEEHTINKFKKVLDVPIKALNIGNSSLIGALCCANSYGIILPPFTVNREKTILLDFLKENDIDLTVQKIDAKNTAFGNLILINDKGCIFPKN